MVDALSNQSTTTDPGVSDGNRSSTVAIATISPLLNSPAWRVGGLVFLAFIGCIGIAGNIVVLSLLARFRALQNGINACVGNIAVCDLIVCVLILPLVFAQRLTDSIILGGDVCLASGCALFVCVGVANSSFALIGLNRYVFVLHQAAYHRCLEGPGHVAVRLSANWILWLALSGIVFSQRAFKYVPDSFLCFFGDDSDSNPALAVAVMLLMVTAPSAVAGFCYCRVLSHAMASRRRIRDLVAGARQIAEHRKLVRSLASVMLNYVLFNLLWLPYFCHVTFVRFLIDANQPVHNFIVWLALCSCTVKPLLQLTLNSNFRRKLEMLVECCGKLASRRQSTGAAAARTKSGAGPVA